MIVKVHVSAASKVADHCIAYSLSDPKDKDYQTVCKDHKHDLECDRCSILRQVLQDIKDSIACPKVNCSSDDKEEMEYIIKQAEESILAWKAHLLRSINQDEARLRVLDKLEPNSILLVQDWAMKYLPRKFRESQSDWFAKRGIPWHVTVATRKVPEIEMITFIHLFPACTQDSVAVLSIMDNVIYKLKKVIPMLHLLQTGQCRLLPLRPYHDRS